MWKVKGAQIVLGLMLAFVILNDEASYIFFPLYTNPCFFD